ncbi:hypothetical protein SU69_01275 [Thermosipho melanesiensis]|uniref:DUF4899 domain-containing protein n=2 Tax=Thermosipho melanesiensis TaxID=46541 RepID=A6LJL3_THEM4|nr:DUF4899 domain-containing protein [Thermosipho melanesiensis]ABR30114.1 hypothetical protein Tmel_0240 [Thermosipho melanesiensis BI429]APT73311.1 hypothetical protein BW47_01315 [Thermosipho melanesiensis]OOC38702.1 hypothetical protein SU68_01275 [Thermosipho melanesiensis]OOC40506.1 hypothetical protein SU70_01275 [Thermosipho melanesiensis]OOC40771.1 hypothetical protein SU69_01275 [Thermosipho melanesiensis]
MDLYFVKVRGRSKATAEVFLGYLFGKVNNVPEFDFLMVPLRFAEKIDEVNLEDKIIDFKENFETLKEELLRDSVVEDLTLSFNSFLNTVFNKRGKIALGIELTAAVKENDVELMKVILGNILEEWSPKSDLEIVAEGLTLEEYSAYNVIDLKEDFEENIIKTIYERSDLKFLPEFFPVIDPINGESIINFDIGDTIYVVPVEFGKLEEKLKNTFPKNFLEDGRVLPFQGKIISKELIPTKKGLLYLCKIDLGNEIYGKFVISPTFKILFDEKVIFEKEKNKEKIEAKERIKVVKPSNLNIPSGSEIFWAFITTMMFSGLLIIILYFLRIL